jgi:hypothetical protein
MLVRIKDVEPLKEYTVRLTFTNGTCRDVDLLPYLHGPIFTPLRDDSQLFRAVYIENGTITWPNGADIDPDVLYRNLTPAWMETDPDVSAPVG